jgi:hypothetical protein
MRRGGEARGRRLLLALAASALVLLGLAQLVLPRIAASTISSRVGRYGKVQSVSVTAWPAVELLWGSADSVRIRIRSLALAPAQAATLLAEASGVARMDVTAANVRFGSLALLDATLSKRGARLSGAATIEQAGVRAALPEGFSVRLLRSEAGRVEVRASGGLFGVGGSLDAVALAERGRLVVHPLGFLLEGLQLTLFADRHVYVEAVAARELDNSPPSYRLTMRARLR